MATGNRHLLIKVLVLFFSLTWGFLLWHGCGGGGDSGTTPTPAKTVVITGTVPGTVAIAYDNATGLEAARNTATGTPQTFALNVLPGNYYLMFIENEDTPNPTYFSFQNVTGGNVFSIEQNTTLDLGTIVFDTVTFIAAPTVNPLLGNDNVTETTTVNNISGTWQFTMTTTSTNCQSTLPPPEVSQGTISQTGNVLSVIEVPGVSGIINGNAVHFSGTDTPSPGESENITMDLIIQPNGTEMRGPYILQETSPQTCTSSGNAVAVKR